MIRSFADRSTEDLFNDIAVPKSRSIESVARRKLLYLHAASRLEDLAVPPGNRLEALRGDRKGQYSIRINDRWRLCLRWDGDAAVDVVIVDHH